MCVVVTTILKRWTKTHRFWPPIPFEYPKTCFRSIFFLVSQQSAIQQQQFYRVWRSDSHPKHWEEPCTSLWSKHTLPKKRLKGSYKPKHIPMLFKCLCAANIASNLRVPDNDGGVPHGGPRERGKPDHLPGLFTGWRSAGQRGQRTRLCFHCKNPTFSHNWSCESVRLCFRAESAAFCNVRSWHCVVYFSGGKRWATSCWMCWSFPGNSPINILLSRLITL